MKLPVIYIRGCDKRFLDGFKMFGRLAFLLRESSELSVSLASEGEGFGV